MDISRRNFLKTGALSSAAGLNPEAQAQERLNKIDTALKGIFLQIIPEDNDELSPLDLAGLNVAEDCDDRIHTVHFTFQGVWEFFQYVANKMGKATIDPDVIKKHSYDYIYGSNDIRELSIAAAATTAQNYRHADYGYLMEAHRWLMAKLPEVENLLSEAERFNPGHTLELGNGYEEIFGESLSLQSLRKIRQEHNGTLDQLCQTYEKWTRGQGKKAPNIRDIFARAAATPTEMEMDDYLAQLGQENCYYDLRDAVTNGIRTEVKSLYEGALRKVAPEIYKTQKEQKKQVGEEIRKRIQEENEKYHASKKTDIFESKDLHYWENIFGKGNVEYRSSEAQPKINKVILKDAFQRNYDWSRHNDYILKQAVTFEREFYVCVSVAGKTGEQISTMLDAINGNSTHAGVMKNYAHLALLPQDSSYMIKTLGHLPGEKTAPYIVIPEQYINKEVLKNHAVAIENMQQLRLFADATQIMRQ